MLCQNSRLGVEVWEVGAPLTTSEELLPDTVSIAPLARPATRSSTSDCSDTTSSSGGSCCSSSPHRPGVASSTGSCCSPVPETPCQQQQYRHSYHDSSQQHNNTTSSSSNNSNPCYSITHHNTRRNEPVCSRCGSAHSTSHNCVSSAQEGVSLGKENMTGHQLSRSKSFGGGSRRIAAGQGGTMTSMGSTQSWQSHYPPVGARRHPVLGQQPPTTPRELRRAFSLPPHVKVPKSPRPERSMMVGGAVVRGLREGVSVTVHDLMALRRVRHASHRAMSQGRMYEAEKQMKGVERYQKRLEFHLSQVEDLLDQYSLHQKLREGVRNMAYAYAVSPGKERTTALNNVRSGYRECTETLCALEVQIEHLIGSLTLDMKGIQGFARLCPGDVFEVTLKHGRQKWRSKGRVGRDGTQTWDNSRAVFKALIGEVLHMKAVEVRLLGKSVLIGARECETRELFSPHPQLMTVNLNHAGSLKLSIVVTWNPLEDNGGGIGGSGGLEDSTTTTMLRTSSLSSAPPTLSGGQQLHPRVLHTSSMGGMSPTPSTFTRLLSRQEISISIPECADNDSSFGSMSARSSSPDSTTSPLPPPDGAHTADTAHNDNTDSQECLSCCSSVAPSCDDTGNFTLVRKKETRTEQWARYSQFSVSNNSNLDLLSRSYPHLPSLSHHPPSSAPLRITEDASHQPQPSTDTHSNGSSSTSLHQQQQNGNLSTSLAALPKDGGNSSLQSLLNAINTTSTQSLLACAVPSCSTSNNNNDSNTQRQSTVVNNTLLSMFGQQDNIEVDHPLSKLSSHSISSIASNENLNLRSHHDSSLNTSNGHAVPDSCCSSPGNLKTSNQQQPIICQPSTSASSSVVLKSSSSLQTLVTSSESGHRSSCPCVSTQHEASCNCSQPTSELTDSNNANNEIILTSKMDRINERIPQEKDTDQTSIVNDNDHATSPSAFSNGYSSEAISSGKLFPGPFVAGVQLGDEVESGRWHTAPDIWDAKNIPNTLPKLVTRVQSCLEDIQGQWPTLHSLEDSVLQLQQICKEPSRRGSVCSEASLSVEAALECFDFLDAESDEEQDGITSPRRGVRLSDRTQGNTSARTKDEHCIQNNMDESVKQTSNEMNGQCSPSTNSNESNNKQHSKNTSSLDSRNSFKYNVNSLDSKCSAKSSQSNTLEDKSTNSSEGSKSSDSSTLEDKSRSSGKSSFSNTLEDKSSKGAEFSSGTSTLELEHDDAEFVHVASCMDGGRELHLFLYVHLKRVLKLLQNVGLFGPLRQLESWSVQELDSEGQMLAAVVKHQDQLSDLRPHHLLTIPHVQVLWDSVSPGSDECWCVSGSAVVAGLLPVVTSLVPPQHTELLPKSVLQRLVERMTDGCRSSYSGAEVVTVGHFLQHMRPPLQDTVPRLAAAILLEQKLATQAVDSIISALAELQEPEGGHVSLLGQLLQSAPPHVVHHVTEYLVALHSNTSAMTQMLDACLMELESRSSDERASACVLLATIAALRPQTPASQQRLSCSSNRNSACLDVPLYINEEMSDRSSSSTSSSNLDQQDEPNKLTDVMNVSVSSSKGSKKKKKKDSENVLSQLLNRRRSNASSTSSTKSSKSNVDSGISSSPKQGSLVSSLESSSSANAKRPAASNKCDLMSSSYPSASSGAHSLAQSLMSSRPHSSYASHTADLTPDSPSDGPAASLSTPSQFIEVLSFVQHNDRSSKVQRAAKLGLQQLGTEGAAVMQQWTLSAHGFQGVEVKHGVRERSCGAVTKQEEPMVYY